MRVRGHVVRQFPRCVREHSVAPRALPLFDVQQWLERVARHLDHGLGISARAIRSAAAQDLPERVQLRSTAVKCPMIAGCGVRCHCARTFTLAPEDGQGPTCSWSRHSRKEVHFAGRSFRRSASATRCFAIHSLSTRVRSMGHEVGPSAGCWSTSRPWKTHSNMDFGRRAQPEFARRESARSSAEFALLPRHLKRHGAVPKDCAPDP